MLADRLLPGEDPHSDYPEDSDLWVEIYAELISVTEGLIRRLQQSSLDEDGSPADVALMQQQLQRFRRRLEFWESKRALITPQAVLP